MISRLTGRRWQILRPELWEKDHVTDAFLAQQHDAEPINPNTDSTCGRHAVFQRNQEILVQFLLLAAVQNLKRLVRRVSIPPPTPIMA